MDSQEIQQPQNHQIVMSRFIAACQADEGVVAAFLGGSYARDADDAYSDLDLYLITANEAYEDFLAGRKAFIRQLGEPVFLEDFHGGDADFVFFTFPDGTEVELGLGRESHFHHIHSGPYRVLLDKKGILAGAVFPGYEPTQAEQIETLRRLVSWFWHDLSHQTRPRMPPRFNRGRNGPTLSGARAPGFPTHTDIPRSAGRRGNR